MQAKLLKKYLLATSSSPRNATDPEFKAYSKEKTFFPLINQLIAGNPDLSSANNVHS